MMLNKLVITTRISTELVDITDKVCNIVSQAKISDGICHIFLPHTTAAIAINENQDPTVARDIVKAMDRLIPWDTIFEHAEGNSAAHIKSSILGNSKALPVENGLIKLGQWQGIFLVEFDGPRQRDVFVKVVEG
jgi:secondary thiamine-phosphate synthase enzyme